MARNRYKVSKRMWHKWSENAQIVFNSLYSMMINNPDIYQHTDYEVIKGKRWRVTAWNAAFEAACHVNSVEKGL